MTTVEDPMPIDEALAIVRRVAAAGRAIQRDIDQIMAAPNNIADHNTPDVPSQADIAEAIGISITNAATNLEKVRERVAFMTGLVDQMQCSLVKLWELLKDLE